MSPNRAVRRVLAAVVVLAAALGIAAVSGGGAAQAAASGVDHVEGNNPTLAQKILGYNAWVRDHDGPPDVLLLGSSRAVALDPTLIKRVTGKTAYNAGITSAGARELLAMGSYADMRSPGRIPHLVVMLDLESFDNRRPNTRVVDYLAREDATYAACPTTSDCRSASLQAAHLIANDAVRRQRGAAVPYTTTQRADGKQINSPQAKLVAAGVNMNSVRNSRIAARIASYRPGAFDHLYPIPSGLFAQLLQRANAAGDQPTLALTALHPDCLERCGAAGWNDRHSEVLAMLDQLQVTYDFSVLDLSVPSTWRGSGSDFYDEIHLRPVGASRVVHYLALQGAFTRPG